MSLWTPLRRQKEVKDIFISYYAGKIARELNLSPQDFTKIDFPNRLDVRPDTLVYNRKEDPYIFDQSKGKVPEYFTVYFDDVYICGFGTDEPQQKIDLEFWRGLRGAYKSQKIRFNKGLAKKLKDEQEQKIKEARKEAELKINKLPDATPTQKLAKEAIRRISAQKNKSSNHAT